MKRLAISIRIQRCLLTIIPTLSVTTVVTTERSFLTLRRLNTYLRNNTEQDRLIGLALVNIYRNYGDTDIDQAINRFTTLPRKLDYVL